MEERFGLASIYQASDKTYNMTVTDDDGKVHVIAQALDYDEAKEMALKWRYGVVLEKKDIRRRILPPIVGISEAAEIMGWDRRKLSIYVSRGSFPAPEYKLSAGPVWLKEQIEEFRDKH